VLRTGAELLTDRQRHRLSAVFADEAHVEVEATWGIYQRIAAAYRDPDRAAAKTELTNVIATISAPVPTELTELITLGRTLKRRATDVLAYFDRAGTSNGPTEAINAPPGTPTRLRPRIPQPHQLHHKITTRDRRLQTTTTPSIRMSPIRSRGPVPARRPGPSTRAWTLT
jgi:hypothetical protein